MVKCQDEDRGGRGGRYEDDARGNRGAPSRRRGLGNARRGAGGFDLTGTITKGNKSEPVRVGEKKNGHGWIRSDSGPLLLSSRFSRFAILTLSSPPLVNCTYAHLTPIIPFPYTAQF